MIQCYTFIFELACISIFVTLIFWMCVHPRLPHMLHHLGYTSSSIPDRCHIPIASHLITIGNICMDPLVFLSFYPSHSSCCCLNKIWCLIRINIGGVTIIMIVMLIRWLSTYLWLKLLDLWPHIWLLTMFY